MLKTIFLNLLLAAASYSHAQDLAQLNCPSLDPIPLIVVDKDGNMEIPNLIPYVEANNPGLDLTFTQNPAAGIINHNSTYGPGTYFITVIGWGKDGQAKATCTQNYLVKDTIPPSLVNVTSIGGWRLSGFSCSLVLNFDFWSNNVYDNTGLVKVISPTPGYGIGIERGKTGSNITVLVEDRFGNRASKEVFVGYPGSYSYPQELATTWAANKTINCDESTAPANTGITISSSNTPCAPQVSYSDESTQGSDPTKPNYYNYTITRNWTVAPFFTDAFSQAQVITVQDKTPPVLSSLTPNQTVLPAGKREFYDISLDYTSADGCSPVTNTVTVSSNEKIKGKGGPEADWEIVNDYLVRLKAESGNGGEDRVYTITVTSVDVSGNSTSKSTTVTVVKSKGKNSQVAGASMLTNLQIVETEGLQVTSAPNPSASHFNIRVASAQKSGKVLLRVTNALGQLVEVRTLAAGQTISLGSAYQSGIYYVEAIQGGQKASLKLVKTK